MRRVQQPVQYPHHCAVIPFKGGSNSAGFIDTGVDLIGVDPHVYISLEAAVEIAKEIGWTGPTKVGELEQRIAALEAENDDVRTQLQEADRFAEAAEYTLGRFGQKVQNKPGRKAKQKVEA